MKFKCSFQKSPQRGTSDLSKNCPVRIHKVKTLEETRANLREAIELTLAANRALAEEDIAELQDVIREPISVHP